MKTDGKLLNEDTVQDPVTRPSRDSLLLVILLAALAVRLGFAFWLGSQVYWFDEGFYDDVASSSVDGNGLVRYGVRPTSFRSPLYMMFVSSTYATFGRNLLAVRLLQAFAGAGTCFLVYLLGRRLFSETEGYVAAGIAAIYPLLVYTNNVIYPETLTSLLLLCMVLLLLRLDRRPEVVSAVALGVIVGASALSTVPTLLFSACALCWFVINKRRSFGHRFLVAGMCTLVAVCAIAPWTYRNYLVHGHFVPVTTNSGYVLWYGNHPSQGASVKHVHEPDFTPDPSAEGSYEWQKDKFLRTEAIRFMRANPARTALMMFLKGLNLWRPYPDTSTENEHTGILANAVIGLSYSVVACLAVFSLASRRIRMRERILLLILFGSFTVAYAVFFSRVRYRVPLDCILVVLAAAPMTLVGRMLCHVCKGAVASRQTLNALRTNTISLERNPVSSPESED